MNYKDVFGWFPEESAVALDKIIKEHGIKTVIEIGSFLGRSTIFFAERCERVTAIDPFKREGWADAEINGDAYNAGEDFYPNFISNINRCGVSDKIDVLRMTSKRALQQPIFADLVYIDGAHDYDNVFNDIKAWKDRANIIICGDDYDENWKSVKQAVDEVFPDKIIDGRIWYKII